MKPRSPNVCYGWRLRIAAWRDEYDRVRLDRRRARWELRLSHRLGAPVIAGVRMATDISPRT